MIRRSRRASRAGKGRVLSRFPFPVSRSVSRRISRLHIRRLVHDGRLATRQDKPPFPERRHDQDRDDGRSEEHTSELQSQSNLVCRLLLEKKKMHNSYIFHSSTRDTKATRKVTKRVGDWLVSV